MKSKQLTPQKLIPYFSYQYGDIYLGDSQQLLQSVESSSVNLILTSPPFALTRKKEYGNESASKYIEWFLPFAYEFQRILTADGSLVLELGGAYLPGLPERSIYQYELLVKLCNDVGLYLAQEFYHYNSARLPAPAEWVNIRRIRVKDAVNVVWWLSKTPYPKADNRKVLKPYSDSMQLLLQKGYKPKKRPSGHKISTHFSKNNNGAIPPNLLEIANTESNSAYLRCCKAKNIKPHPARFPESFVEFFVNFLTDEGDMVLDPFAGSNTTGKVAEKLKRRWMSFEINEVYIKSSQCRFADAR